MLTAAQFVEHLSRLCEKPGGQAALARKTGVPVSVICETLKGKREAPASLANALGYVKRSMFVPMEELR